MDRTRIRDLRSWLVVAASLAIVGTVFHSSFERPSARIPDTVPVAWLDPINDGAEAVSRRAIEIRGWSVGLYGLCLTAGKKGSLVLPIPHAGGELLDLRLWLYRPSRFITNQVSLSADDGKSWSTILTNVDLNGNPLIPLDRGTLFPRRLLLKIEAADQERPGAPERLVLDQYELLSHRPLPRYARPAVFGLFFSLVGLFFLIETAGPSEKTHTRLWGAAAIVLALVFGGILGTEPDAPPILFQAKPIVTGAALLAGAIALVAIRTGRWDSAVSSLSVLVLSLAFWRRWISWRGNASPLYPDAFSFLKLSSPDGPLYSTGSREPLFVWILRAASSILGFGEDTVRFTSLLIGLALVYAVFALGRRLFGAGIGLCAAAFLALHQTLANLSIQGLRDELFALLVACFLFITLPTGESWTPLRSCALALVSAGIFLTRMNAAPAVILLLLFFKWRRSWPWSRVLVSCAVATGLLLPYLLYCRATFHDPFYSMNILSTGFRNMEFGGRPGFPSREAVATDLFAGPTTTTFGYLFGLHRPAQIVANVIHGYSRSLFGYWASRTEFFPGGYEYSFPAYVIGLALLLFRRRGPRVSVAPTAWELWFTLWVFLAPVAFLAGAEAFKVDWRLLAFLLIGYALAVGATASALLAGLRFVVRRVKVQSFSPRRMPARNRRASS